MNHPVFVPDVSLSIAPNQILFKDRVLSGVINNIEDYYNTSIPISLNSNLDEDKTYYLRIVLQPFSNSISFCQIIDENTAKILKSIRWDDIYLPLWKRTGNNVYYFGVPNLQLKRDDKEFSIKHSATTENGVLLSPFVPNNSQNTISRQFFNKISGNLLNGEGLFASVEILNVNNSQFIVEKFQLINTSKNSVDVKRNGQYSTSLFPIAYKENGKIIVSIWDGLTIRVVSTLSGEAIILT